MCNTVENGWRCFRLCTPRGAKCHHAVVLHRRQKWVIHRPKFSQTECGMFLERHGTTHRETEVVDEKVLLEEIGPIKWRTWAVLEAAVDGSFWDSPGLCVVLVRFCMCAENTSPHAHFSQSCQSTWCSESLFFVLCAHFYVSNTHASAQAWA